MSVHMPRVQVHVTLCVKQNVSVHAFLVSELIPEHILYVRTNAKTYVSTSFSMSSHPNDFANEGGDRSQQRNLYDGQSWLTDRGH